LRLLAEPLRGYNCNMSTIARLITAEELFAMPDHGGRCELIDGETMPMAPAGGLHGYVGGILSGRLATHVIAKQLGIVLLAETGFLISRNPDTVLAPDAAFITSAQIASLGVPNGYLPYAPMLVIEVMSPRDTVADVADMMHRWIDAGVKVAWVVDPAGRTVTVHRSHDDIRVLTAKDILTGEQVVPGFECPVAELFANL
jgi:Uma2 family endonuclease